VELRELRTEELLGLYCSVLRELRRRGVCKSSNGLPADYAEGLVVEALGLTLSPKSNKGYDATDNSGRRYQAKSRWLTPENASREPYQAS
jgi:hypothetical protein